MIKHALKDLRYLISDTFVYVWIHSFGYIWICLDTFGYVLDMCGYDFEYGIHYFGYAQVNFG